MLSVSHLQQRSQADCLPICAQMVLSYLGKQTTYQKLVKLLDTRGFGTPFRNLQRLEQLAVAVALISCTTDDISHYLRNNVPVIASLNTADLKYWPQAVEHAVGVTGLDSMSVYVNDPSLNHGHHPIPQVEFALAQLKFDHLCAIIEV